MKTKILNFNIDYPDFNEIVECGKIIRNGGLVIFPTDTVYGIAADSSNPQAVARLKDVKKRSEDKPFSVLIMQMNQFFDLTSSENIALYKLIDKYWPGPLTVVVPQKEGEENIGIRMPNDIIALRLIQESQRVLVAPSANIQGNPEPRTCDEALKDLDGLVEVAVDGGETRLGKGSTVVRLVKDIPEVLREGVVSQQDIMETVNTKTVLFVCTGNSCRSVMAEYVMKEKLAERTEVEILSAGTSVFLNTAASSGTTMVLSEKGIDASRHISRPLSTVLLKKTDFIFAMTQSHRAHILSIAPELKNRVFLFKEAMNELSSQPRDVDVPDPMGMSVDIYKDCLSVIEEGVDAIIEKYLQ